jgi:hypothetical protein
VEGGGKHVPGKPNNVASYVAEKTTQQTRKLEFQRLHVLEHASMQWLKVGQQFVEDEPLSRMHAYNHARTSKVWIQNVLLATVSYSA